MGHPSVEILDQCIKNHESFRKFLELLSSDWGCVIALLTIFIWLLANIRNGKFTKKRPKEILRLERLLELLSKTDDSDLRYSIRDKIKANIFKEATGVYAEGKSRKNIIKFHLENSEIIEWEDVEYGLMYMDTRKSASISLRPWSFMDYFTTFINLSMTLIFMLFSVVFLCLVLTPMNYEAKLYVFTMFAVSSALLAAAIIQLRPVIAYKKIERALRSNQPIVDR